MIQTFFVVCLYLKYWNWHPERRKTNKKVVSLWCSLPSSMSDNKVTTITSNTRTATKTSRQKTYAAFYENIKQIQVEAAAGWRPESGKVPKHSIALCKQLGLKCFGKHSACNETILFCQCSNASSQLFVWALRPLEPDYAQRKEKKRLKEISQKSFFLLEREIELRRDQWPSYNTKSVSLALLYTLL